MNRSLLACLLVLVIAAAPFGYAADVPKFDAPLFSQNGTQPEPVKAEGSFTLLGESAGTQAAVARRLGMCAMAVQPGESTQLTIPLAATGSFTITADAVLIAGDRAEVSMTLNSGGKSLLQFAGGKAQLSVTGNGTFPTEALTLGVFAPGSDVAVRWCNVRCSVEGATGAVPLFPIPITDPPLPIPLDLVLNPILEDEVIQWDWRMQDGIGTERAPDTYASAIEKTLARGDALLAELAAEGLTLEPERAQWKTLREQLAITGQTDEVLEKLWLQVHKMRRQIAFANPLSKVGPLLFVKQIPPVFSHQLTQYYGRYARPGGGVFVLDRPGENMLTRPLTTQAFPAGSFMHPEVSHDGSRVIVAFCEAETVPEDTRLGQKGRFYHLYEITSDGSGVRKLTDGEFDDFAPRELPNGEIVFISTRRGGMHRCGSPGCDVYTLTLMNPDGTNIRTISWHETQEWDPAVLNDGRIVYTRWDYVDRNAVFYEQLWSSRPDGSAPSAFYGNNTLNPVGVWEPRAIPGSDLVMATAAPHHGMTAGSIILVDVSKGVDGLEPLTRLTPETPFPESEELLQAVWRSAVATEPPVRYPDMDRWPGQCYRSPYPLSEKFFLAAYSFDTLIGEPKGNPANMFGLYWVDAFGNKELIYRDLNQASAWPSPLTARPRPPVLPPSSIQTAYETGTYFVKNVQDSDPALPPNSVKSLRVVQVLPKSTSGANNPPVGAPFASPGRQVLGTVPVESDGSAYFRAPAGIPLAFQALDETGQAVQIMRSVTYLQSGEQASCIGCHENRLSAPEATRPNALAAKRPPSEITPGPDGSNPMSYPILVQPVLEKHCVKCHSGDKPAGPEGKPVVLTGVPEGKYTSSYNALVARVSFSSWGRGVFPDGNCEPLCKPGFFGAKGSPLTKMLMDGHNDVKLEPEEWDRLVTWMDSNALFYGTFDFADQDRQQRGERIAGPALQ